jgi:hypothetical protein
MAQDYDNTNRGSIWKNDKKETDNHPDFTGSLNVDGVDYWLSGWKRKPDASDKAPALSFTVKAKEESGSAAKKPNSTTSSKAGSSNNFDDFEDDIPF